MARVRFKLRDVSRNQKKYPIVNSPPVYKLVSDNLVEIENQIVDITDTDQVTVTFSKAFTGSPAISAILITDSAAVGNVNVYVGSVTTTSAIIKTSAVITGKISVQAVYIDP